MNIVDHYLSCVAGEHINSYEILTEDELSRIFYVLTRQEEIDNAIRNKWGNWRFSYTNEKYDEPYIDQFVISILNGKGIQRKSIWPDNRKFALWLTHDVDAVTHNSALLDYRLGSRRNQNSVKNRIRWILETKENDPLWHFEDWLKVESQSGFKSTFFFFVAPNHQNIWIRDCLYTPDDYIKYKGKKMKVKEMIKEVHNAGWEIGLHCSYNTFNNAELLREQKAILEEIISDEVNAVRQHYLHYDIIKTPKVQSEAGVKLDSTQGFARTLGFRAGTCYPYLTYNHDHGDALDTLEIPMIIMDDPLFNDDGLELYGEYAVQKCIEFSNKVENVGGILTVNFHANHLIQKDWFGTYSKLLNYFENVDSYGLTSSEILDSTVI